MFSIYIIYVYIRGVWGARAPQKPTTHYKNKIKWRLFLYGEPGYFFIFFSGQARFFFFLLFAETNYFFFTLFRVRLFFSIKTRDRKFFWKITQAPPPPPPPPPEYQMVGPLRPCLLEAIHTFYEIRVHV